MINDSVFGKMNYDFDWTKDEEINLWGKAYTLGIIVQSEDGENIPISKLQQDAYSFFKSNFSLLEEKAMSALLNYCRGILDIDDCSRDYFLAHSKPTAIFFSLNGDWGILFDSDFDEENGITVMFSNGEFMVGPQDILI